MKSHHFHFLVLMLILLIGVATFFFARGNTSLQLQIGIITSVSYVAWGIIHHATIGDIHAKIVIEYILIGGIAIAILMTMLL